MRAKPMAKTVKTQKDTTVAEVKSNLPAKVETLAIAKMDMQSVVVALADLGATGLSPFDLDRIPFPTADSLTYNIPTEEGADPRRFIDGIVVHQHAGRQFYEGSYVPGVSTSPRCASFDGMTGHGDPGGLCVECPFGAFGGGCKPYRYLYILFPDEIFPKLLVLPRTSLNRKLPNGAPKYFFNLAKKGKRASDVVTRIGLGKRPQGLGMVATFTEGPGLSTEQLQQIRAYAEQFKKSLTFPAAPGPAVDPTAGENGHEVRSGSTAGLTTDYDEEDDI